MTEPAIRGIRRRQPALTIAVMAIAFLIAGCGMGAESNGNRGNGTTSTDEWRNIYGGPPVERWTAATNQAEWDAMWASLGVEAPVALADGLVGVGVFLGGRRSGGFAITIDSQKVEDGIFVVSYSEIAPGPNSVVTMALTAPYVIWTIADPGFQIIVEKTTP
jgi:hypothetical protein